ncbi:MAG: hypothetical protein ABJA66_18345 [Actinomycetota bacterium]
MKSNFIGVSFKADGNQGLSEAYGVAKFSSAGIVFDFESKIFGFIGGEVKEVRVSLDEILDIKFRKGVFKFFARIQLRLKNVAKFAELPNENGKVTLKIKREDFESAQKAVEQTLQIMNEVGLQILPEGDDSNKRLPAFQTSINELFDTEKLETEDLKETEKLKINRGDK